MDKDVTMWFLESNEKNALMEFEETGNIPESWCIGDDWPFEIYRIIDVVGIQQY